MCEGYMVVGNVVEKVDCLLLQHQGRCDRVDRGVTLPLVEEAAVLVERLEVIGVGLGPEPVEAANLKIRPLGDGR